MSFGQPRPKGGADFDGLLAFVNRVARSGPSAGYGVAAFGAMLAVVGAAFTVSTLWPFFNERGGLWLGLLTLIGLGITGVGLHAFRVGVSAIRNPRVRATAEEFLREVAAAGPGARVCIGCRILLEGELVDCSICRNRERPFRVATENDLKILETVVRAEQ